MEQGWFMPRQRDNEREGAIREDSAIRASVAPKLILGFFLFALTFVSEDFVQMKLEPLNHLVGERFLVVSAGLPLAALALSYLIFCRRAPRLPEGSSRLRKAWSIAKRVLGIYAVFIALLGAVDLTEGRMVQSVDVPAFIKGTDEWRRAEQQLGFRVSIQEEAHFSIQRIFFFRSPGRSESVAALAAVTPQATGTGADSLKVPIGFTS
jgi:hypothetical protein